MPPFIIMAFDEEPQLSTGSRDSSAMPYAAVPRCRNRRLNFRRACLEEDEAFTAKWGPRLDDV